MLNGSSFEIEKAYIEQYRGNNDVSFGIEKRMKGQEAEQQFNEFGEEQLEDSSG